MTELHPNHLHAILSDAAYVADPLGYRAPHQFGRRQASIGGR